MPDGQLQAVSFTNIGLLAGYGTIIGNIANQGPLKLFRDYLHSIQFSFLLYCLRSYSDPLFFRYDLCWQLEYSSISRIKPKNQRSTLSKWQSNSTNRYATLINDIKRFRLNNNKVDLLLFSGTTNPREINSLEINGRANLGGSYQ
jgi:hypothetical protein